MQILFDNLISVAVGAIVLALLAGLYISNQNANVDAFRSEANRSTLIDFVHVVERDLRNAGSGASADKILSWSAASPESGQSAVLLDFFTTVDTSANATAQRMRYELAHVSTSVVQGEVVPLYQLRRLEYNGSAFTLSSSSTPTLTEFQLVLLDATGAPTTDVAQARAFAVQTSTISALGSDKIVGDSRWQTVIWPLNLRL
ncbi:hypothetical protein BH23BAC4_BH23BAC4_11080 [soil metagenome]